MDNIDSVGARLMIASRTSTYTELSSILGITPQAVSRAFRLGRIPRSWVQSIAEKFNVSPDWIKYGDKLDGLADRQEEDDIIPFLDNKNRMQSVMQICRMIDSLKGDNVEDLSHFLGLEPTDIHEAILRGYIPDEWTDELSKALGVSRDKLILGYERILKKAPGKTQPVSASAAQVAHQINHDYSKMVDECALDLTPTEFKTLWDRYWTEKEARRGWLQVEITKRFPEFVEWLKSQPKPISTPSPVAIKRAGETMHYGLPDQLDDD